ncbi:hypothetical protein HK100_005296 [Physocladia obscura]|uniref:Uncharacterized protein n=1 Tax=Physocladia obscura TaxID=109957 RepID=A0AAD5TBS1_9FUNG|nr:hypothetical protein HK100_005296 [Physocladia obscura]
MATLAKTFYDSRDSQSTIIVADTENESKQHQESQQQQQNPQEEQQEQKEGKERKEKMVSALDSVKKSTFCSHKKVNFWGWVDVGFSHSIDEYDRKPIAVDPLTKEAAFEVMEMRVSMKRVSDEMYKWRSEYENNFPRIDLAPPLDCTNDITDASIMMAISASAIVSNSERVQQQKIWVTANANNSEVKRKSGIFEISSLPTASKSKSDITLPTAASSTSSTSSIACDVSVSKQPEGGERENIVSLNSISSGFRSSKKTGCDYSFALRFQHLGIGSSGVSNSTNSTQAPKTSVSAKTMQQLQSSSVFDAILSLPPRNDSRNSDTCSTIINDGEGSDAFGAGSDGGDKNSLVLQVSSKFTGQLKISRGVNGSQSASTPVASAVAKNKTCVVASAVAKNKTGVEVTRNTATLNHHQIPLVRRWAWNDRSRSKSPTLRDVPSAVFKLSQQSKAIGKLVGGKK